jgi:hypothetical protein
MTLSNISTEYLEITPGWSRRSHYHFVSTEDLKITPWWNQRSHYDFVQHFNRIFRDHPLMNSKVTLWLCPTFQQKISRSPRDKLEGHIMTLFQQKIYRSPLDELEGHIMTLSNISTEDLEITPWWIQRSHYDFVQRFNRKFKITPWWTQRSHYDFVQHFNRRFRDHPVMNSKVTLSLCFNRRFKDHPLMNSKVTLWLCPTFQQKI